MGSDTRADAADSPPAATPVALPEVPAAPADPSTPAGPPPDSPSGSPADRGPEPASDAASDTASDTALVEAVIYLEGEPVDERAIATITGLDRRRVENALARIREVFSDARHGVELIGVAGGFAFAPKQSLAESLQARYGRRSDNRLSRAALETLSIVAYSQPVTRAEIEGIRGVSAEGMIKLLASRDLIKIVGKREAPGKPVEYGTTKEFLKLFRLSSIADLPKLDEVDREKYAAEE